MLCPNYNKATNLAYQVLLFYGLHTLPIDLEYLIKRLPANVRIKSYSDLATLSQQTYADLLPKLPSEKGFFAYQWINANYLIYYNDLRDNHSIRFTIAHELGHYFLDHIIENTETDKEANCFARNLLSPYPVIASAQLITAESISACCNISDFAAQVRLDRRGSDGYWASNALSQALIQDFDCELISMLYA